MVVPGRVTYLIRAALLAALVWSAGIQAALAQSDLPTIVHTLVEQAYADTHLIIRASISEATLVDQVRLFFRPPGESEFYSMTMTPINGEYRVVIPASYLVPGILEYYIQARDIRGNSWTYPSEGYQPAPQQLMVVADNTIPQIELIQPRKWTPGGGYTLFILLHDAAGNINPSTIRLYFNDVDVTAKASIADSVVMYRIPAAADTFRTRVRVTVSDLAGNQADRTFRLWRAVDWSGELLLDMKNGNWSGSHIAFTSTWGPLDVRLKLSPPTIDGQSQTEWTLKYDARLMHLELGDVVSQLAPAALGLLKYKGRDLVLRLGPISLRTVHGYAQNNSDYQRLVLAIKPALDTRFLDLSLAVVKLKDYPRGNLAPVDVDPQLNYVIDAQGGLTVFNELIGVRAEASVSIYHDNARGDLWSVLDEIDAREVAEGDDALADTLVTLIKYLQSIPAEMRGLFELPDVRYGLPKVDLGGKVNAWVPLPWSQLQASAYRYGRSYQTINNKMLNNREGFTANYDTIRFFNFLQLSGRYEYQLDNVASLLDLLTHNKLADRTATRQFEGSVSLGPAGGVNLNLGVAYGESAPLGAEVEQVTTGYTLDLQNLHLHVATALVTLDTQVRLHDYQIKTNPLADKKVLEYQLRGNVEQGAWTYSLSYGQQVEKDALGSIRYSAPSLAGRIKLQLDDIAFFGTWPKGFMLQLSGSRNLPVSTLDDQTEPRYYAKLNIDAELRLLDQLRLSTGWQYGFNPDAAPQSSWYAGLRWRF
jgi:hypothetical protein